MLVLVIKSKYQNWEQAELEIANPVKIKQVKTSSLFVTKNKSIQYFDWTESTKAEKANLLYNCLIYRK